MDLELCTRHVHLTGHHGFLRKGDVGIIPFDNLARFVGPQAGWQQCLQHALVKLSDLPPGITGELVLDFDDDDPALVGHKDDSIRLAIPPLNSGMEPQPGTLEVHLRVPEPQVLMDLLLVADPLGPGAGIMVLTNRGRPPKGGMQYFSGYAKPSGWQKES